LVAVVVGDKYYGVVHFVLTYFIMLFQYLFVQFR